MVVSNNTNLVDDFEEAFQVSFDKFNSICY